MFWSAGCLGGNQHLDVKSSNLQLLLVVVSNIELDLFCNVEEILQFNQTLFSVVQSCDIMDALSLAVGKSWLLQHSPAEQADDTSPESCCSK